MQLFVEFESVASFAQEVENHLAKGRYYLAGEHGLGERERCELVLIHPESGEWMPLAAEAVYVAQPGQPPGVGLELVDRGPAQTRTLLDFAVVADAPTLDLASSAACVVPTEHPSSSETPLEEGSGPASVNAADVAAGEILESAALPPEEPTSEDEMRLSLVPSAAPQEVPESERTSQRPTGRPPGSQYPPPESDRAFALNPAQRVRQLNAREREKLARKGNLAERTALERAFGAPLWEPLLSNPQLTGPEVARIAKNGTVTQPILNVIVGNPSWIQKAEVRRALLSNPKLRGQNLDKVLRAVPRPELEKIPRQTAYPAMVRSAATKMLPPR